MSSCLMITCRNNQAEIEMVLKETGAKFPVLFIPPELHITPNKLRDHLQDLIDQITNVDYILLPMGICGNGTLGLQSTTAKLVLTKCSDCIDILLSDEHLKKERAKYSYFLTDGWLNSDVSIVAEYEYTLNKYGETATESVMKMLYKNYKYFTFIDTGSYDIDVAHKKIEELLSVTGLEVNKLEGPLGVLRKMVKLDFDDNFVIVEPGNQVSEAHFGIIAMGALSE